MKRALALIVLACAAPSIARAAQDPKIPYEKYTLPNGLTVLLSQDNRVPLVAVDLWYHVGGMDDTYGRSGFAHLFEHMMFQGSKHVGEDQYFDILQKAGASDVNGTTNLDRTNFYEVLPSNELETALWLESDRMGWLLDDLTEKSLDNQMDVVRNERRERYENVPYGRDRFATAEALFPEGHPLRYLTIGRHEDLEAATVEDVKGFFRRWYVPSNCTIAIVGDFQTPALKKLVEKWFGDFPASKKPERRVPPFVPLTKTKRVTVQDPFAKLRRIHYAWITPGLFEKDDAELDLAADVLAREGTGRLYKILVHDQQLAQSVYAVQSSSNHTFNVVVDLKTGADLAAAERIVDREIERVRTEPIPEREVHRGVIGFQSSYVWGLEALLSRADTLQEYDQAVGQPDWITQDLDRYRKTSAAAIQAAAAKWLGKDARAEIITMPVEGGAP